MIREAIRRRYQLMPYLYTLFDAASREGSPVLRPLVSLFLIIVWAIILTSCFVYRHTAGREYEDLLEGISFFLFPYG